MLTFKQSVGSACVSAVLVCGVGRAADVVWLHALDLSAISQDWGKAHASKSVDEHGLNIGGTAFAKGVGTHANSEWTISLGGGAASFHAKVGVDSEVGKRGSVAFVVLVDGKEAARTVTMRGGEAAREMDVVLKGAKELTLVVEDGGDDINYDHADWAEASITLAAGATARPASVKVAEGEPPTIAPADTKTTAINPPRITGGSPGKPFLFRIPASGTAPLKFAATGLPAGVKLDETTGIISGSLTQEGRHEVRVEVNGPGGKASSTLTIVAAPGAIALTPPMGWNSWNVWGTSVDDSKVRAAADKIVELGLAAHGFQYVNIDDAWEGSRGSDGRIRTNEKFPDMHALADYVHSKGLKLGIYSSPGPKTCAGYEGSYQHEKQDAQTYAEWGVDYLKYDWCSYGGIKPQPTAQELRDPYALMHAALAESQRDVLFSLCQYGMGEVWKWGAQVGGNAWRTTGDITDTWSSMSSIGFGQAELHPFAGPGHWNDPDMLVVGQLGWGPKVRPTNLTKAEQVTHITLWSMLASPLLIGCDLTQMDDFTLALLMNPEVLEINQDQLGSQARRVRVAGKTEVWARELADGSVAVALFNRSRGPEKMAFMLEEIGLPGATKMRDVWGRKAIEKGPVEVAGHGAVLVRVGK